MSNLLRVFRTRGLAIHQMLRIEEALLRADTGNWLLINDGTKDPAIVLGISGDPHKLTHVQEARAAGVPLIKRFTGGGTVIVDSNTVFVTMIMQQSALPEVEPFPRSIMQFTGEVYGDVFATLDRDPARVPRTRTTKLTHDTAVAFALRENDYVFGDRKIAGNAQAITKGRWLHHTSFLWDYRMERMRLLTEPARRPEYRGARGHGAFLTSLASLGFCRQDFVEAVEDAFGARGFDTALAAAPDVEAFLQRDYLRTTRVLDYGELLDAPGS